MKTTELALNSHSLKGKSISGKPLGEVVIDNEKANTDIAKARDEPSMDDFPLKIFFDHLMKHFECNIFETFDK